MSHFFGKIGGALTGRTSTAPKYALTDRGEEKLAAMKIEGRQFDILSSIKKLQPTPTVSDIAKDLSWPIGTVQKAVNYLEHEGDVQQLEG